MPRVITPIHKLLKKKKKNKKITSILNKAGSMVTTRLQASRKNIQQQQHPTPICTYPRQCDTIRNKFRNEIYAIKNCRGTTNGH